MLLDEEVCVVKANTHVGLVTTANPNAADNAANIYLAMMILLYCYIFDDDSMSNNLAKLKHKYTQPFVSFCVG